MYKPYIVANYFTNWDDPPRIYWIPPARMQSSPHISVLGIRDRNLHICYHSCHLGGSIRRPWEATSWGVIKITNHMGQRWKMLSQTCSQPLPPTGILCQGVFFLIQVKDVFFDCLDLEGWMCPLICVRFFLICVSKCDEQNQYYHESF